MGGRGQLPVLPGILASGRTTGPRRGLWLHLCIFQKIYFEKELEVGLFPLNSGVRKYSLETLNWICLPCNTGFYYPHSNILKYFHLISLVVLASSFILIRHYHCAFTWEETESQRVEFTQVTYRDKSPVGPFNPWVDNSSCIPRVTMPFIIREEMENHYY